MLYVWKSLFILGSTIVQIAQVFIYIVHTLWTFSSKFAECAPPVLIFKFKVRPQSYRSYLIWLPWSILIVFYFLYQQHLYHHLLREIKTEIKIKSNVLIYHNVLPLHLKQTFLPIFEFSPNVKVMGWNPDYLSKYFLL